MTEKQSDQRRKSPVAEPADNGDVGAAAALHEPGAFGEVGAREQGADEGRNFCRVR